MGKCHRNDKDTLILCDELAEKIRGDLGFVAKVNDVGRCPFCGESLEDSEPKFPWWVHKGIIIEDGSYNICVIVDNTHAKYGDRTFEIKDWTDFEPISGPFSMIPVWATLVHFYDDGSGYFFSRDEGFKGLKPEFPVWNDCPDEFHGKIFSLDGLK